MAEYYTPTIEEFHVGFEYGIFEYKFPNRNEGGWRKSMITPKHIRVENREYLEENLSLFRVKCLDREDIESLGFECTNDHIGFLTFKKQGCIIELAPKNPNEAPVVRITRDSSSSKFEGTIKNKSELKRILKQLGI